MYDKSLVFDHVHLISEDPPSAASWYVEKLGGEIKENQEVMGASQLQIALGGVIVNIRGRRPGEKPDTKHGLQWGTDHFAFQVRGVFDDYCNELKSKNVTFTMDPFDFTPKIRIAFIEAPDGVIIELLQRKD